MEVAWLTDRGWSRSGLDPEILDERRGPGSIEQDLRVPQGLACWPGHFPARAIVPGVLQVDWAMRLAMHWRGGATPARIEALKFKRPVGPGQCITLALTVAGERVDFRLVDGATVFSLGRLVIEPEGQP